MWIASVPLLLFFLPEPLMAFGILWAPVGAIVCGVSAHFRGLPPVRYTIAGLAYSALIFLPWIYLILRIHKVPIPRFVVKFAYIIIYVFWFGVILIGVIVAAPSDPPTHTPPELLPQPPSPFMVYLEIGAVALNGVTWLISLIWLVLVDKSRRRQEDISDSAYLPSPAYISPFALTLVWSLVTRVLAYADPSTAIPSIFSNFFLLLSYMKDLITLTL